MFTGVAKHLEPGVGLLHAQVRDDHVEAAQTKLLLGGGDSIDDRADVAQTPKRLGHDLGMIDLVLDDQELRVNCLVLSC